MILCEKWRTFWQDVERSAIFQAGLQTFVQEAQLPTNLNREGPQPPASPVLGIHVMLIQIRITFFVSDPVTCSVPLLLSPWSVSPFLIYWIQIRSKDTDPQHAFVNSFCFILNAFLNLFFCIRFVSIGLVMWFLYLVIYSLLCDTSSSVPVLGKDWKHF